MSPKAYIVMDGMWGSCGKGSLAGKLALERKPDVIVCNFGPNAGHTFIDQNDKKVMTQQLPTGLVHKRATLMLGPGSIIDPKILASELGAFSEYEPEKRLLIHPRAAIVCPEDKDTEKALVAIGSTRKGTAAAVVRKVMRAECGLPRTAAECNDPAIAPFVISEEGYDRRIREAKLIQIESAQGVELSLNRGFSYPTCTSRDVTPESILNDVAVPMRFLAETCVVLRTFPIRVGNEYDTEGREIGHSGPVYPDMEEITWAQLSEELGVELLERTTVTKKVRRVFRFSFDQLRHALYVTGKASLFLNYMNYLDPHAGSIGEANVDATDFLEDVAMFAKRENGSQVRWLGWGPAINDVEDVHSFSLGFE